MRAEIVTPSRELFGSDRSALRLAALLRDLGVETHLVVPRARPELGLTALAAKDGVPVTPAPVLVASSGGISDPWALTARSVGAAAVDLTIYNSAAVVVRAGDSRPRVLMLREWLDPRSVRHRLLGAVHGRRMTAAVAVSQGVADRWRACAGDRVGVDVCHNWLDDEWLSDGGNGGGGEGVLFLGRLNAWKGHDMLADAFERAFAGARSRPSLTFVGAEGPESPFHRAAEQFRRRCEGHGWQLLPFTPTPRPVLARAALVAVPSLRPEPFGNVVLEALATGARVVAFPGGGIDDLAPLFGDALTVVDRDAAALAEVLRLWWLEGGRPQAPETHRRVLERLRDRFSAAAARPHWQQLIARLGR